MAVDVKRAVIVWDGDPEFLELVASLGYEVVGRVLLTGTSSRQHLTRGKVEEVRTLVEREGADVVIVDAALKSSQWFNLERELRVRVLDKVNLILEIFADRARTKEAKLQVELARLKYEVPRVREMIHREKMGERAGFMGGGEYPVADYYLLIQRRIRKIREQLRALAEKREVMRRRRGELGFYIVSIAGYTNSGKSTLLRALTGEEVEIEGRMFSTLSTRTARLPTKVRILLTDTVGLVEGLPAFMIEAFRPTFEEVYHADLVLLLVDASDPVEEVERKTRAVLEYLFPECEGKVLPVLNKVDIAEDLSEKARVVRMLVGEDPVPVSARGGQNLDSLVEAIIRNIPMEMSYDLRLPNVPCSQRLLHYVYEHGLVEHVEYGAEIHLKFRIPGRYAAEVEELISQCGGIYSGNGGGAHGI